MKEHQGNNNMKETTVSKATERKHRKEHTETKAKEIQ